MSNDNKTLADVQPGGKVRLGDRLPEAVAQALAVVNEVANDARRAGDYKVANALVTARVTLSKQLLALSAQPSPGAKDARELLAAEFDKNEVTAAAARRLRSHNETAVEAAALRVGAARQPVEAAPQGCDACDRTGIRQNDEGRNICCPDCDLGRVCAGDIRQPVGQARVAWASTGATGHKVVAMPGLHKLPYGDYDLYAIPHAQALDLDELRRAICVVGVVGQIDGHDVVRRNSVLDVIDFRRQRQIDSREVQS
ncbi:hypothetical protein AR276_23835 [Stenotrophomonas maltophilia]|nr:hypothetical protein AR276_23835 [Stenotrophomonas maltophilia]